jgi:hypothetical protein
VAQPTTQLNATEQDTLVKQIGLALLRAAPRDWRRVTAEYRAVGRYHEMTGEILTEDGTTQEWVATHDIATLFGRLRAGMYRDGRGTWFNARYQLDHPSSYNLEYNRDEPQWKLAPPPLAYSDELRMFPRSEDNVPEWVIRRMSGLGPEQQGPRFRIARIFDSVGPAGRPVINRPDLDAEEQDRLLDYLDSAPFVVSDRGYDIDRLATTPEATVPVAFHSDGRWIWPAAVNFYLREYGVSPEPELVEHVRAVDFSLPEVDEKTLQAAGVYLQPPRPPAPAQPQQPQASPAPPPPPPPPAPPAAAPTVSVPAVSMPAVSMPAVAEEQAVPSPGRDEASNSAPEPPAPPFEEAFDQTQFHDPINFDEPYDDDFDDHGHFTEPTHAEETREPAEDAREDDLEQVREGMRSNGSSPGIQQPTTFPPEPQVDPGPPTMMSPPVPAGPAHSEPAPAPDPQPEPQHAQRPEPPVPAVTPQAPGRTTEQREPALLGLQNKLRELAVPEDIYRIGEPNERGWSVEQVESGWRVGWYDGELTNPAMFGDAEDAAAFMLGKLLLAPGGRLTGAHEQSEPAEEAPQPSVLATPSPEVATGSPAGHAAEEQPRAETARPESPIRDGLDDELQKTTLGLQRIEDSQPAAPPRREPPAPTVAVPPLSQPVTPPGPPVAPPAQPATPPRREEPGRPAFAQGDQRPGSGGQQWPIYPMAGEPPLTLFRGKELRELPAGSELDRFGGPNGNLTYAAGTPFEERSLVPEWVNRPYHVYRVQRPIEALSGVAIPWFNQPGGGAAYLLPASIEELVADGNLLELDPGDPPID